MSGLWLRGNVHARCNFYTPNRPKGLSVERKIYYKLWLVNTLYPTFSLCTKRPPPRVEGEGKLGEI
jgi:hypothetical protein